MRSLSATAVILSVLASASTVGAQDVACNQRIDPANLDATAVRTFEDDFSDLNLRKPDGSGTWRPTWFYVGMGEPGIRGYNEELQWYVNPNYGGLKSLSPFSVSEGELRITAIETPDAVTELVKGAPYLSGLINSHGKFDQTYGYFEIRAKLPRGRGLWPAFWLMPTDGSSPEIDVFEVLGQNLTTYYATVFSPADPPHRWQGEVPVPDLSAAFHEFGVDWQADFITFYFDRRRVFRVKTPSDWHKKHYLITNLAVGGKWPGEPDFSAPFPAVLEIDYIMAWAVKSYKPELVLCPPTP